MVPIPAAAFVIPFDLANVEESYPPNFPKELDLQAQDSLTGETFAESFKKAQDAHLPGYSIAIADYGISKKGMRKFDVFDTLNLTAYKPESPDTDPIKKHKIIKIYYFFLQCYKIHDETTCTPIDLETLEDKDLKFIPMRCNNQTWLQLVISSLNYRLFNLKESKNTDEEMDALKLQPNVRFQGVCLAKSGKLEEIIPSLKPEDRLNMTKIWLWCATYDL
jgi:hypothetical protein